MKKIVLGVLGVVIVGALGFVGTVAMRPDHLHVERSAVIQASAADLNPFVSDLNLWSSWNPWHDLDPAMKMTYSENTTGVGAWYEWTGNDDVGHGKMTVKTVDATKVTHDLEFFEPWQSKSLITFTFTPEGEATKVTWSMDEDQAFGAKMAGMFMDMDQMLGDSFEKGFAKLEPVAEAAASKRKADEAAEAAMGWPPGTMQDMRAEAAALEQ